MLGRGRRGCRPPPEARDQIHAVMVEAFGEEKASSINATFHECKDQNRGSHPNNCLQLYVSDNVKQDFF